MSSSWGHFQTPRSRAGWRALALGLAELPADAVPAGDRGSLDQLKNLSWDVATGAAFWHTVQLPSLGPGLLPWVVIGVVGVIGLVNGRWPAAGWPNWSDPFILWPSVWLVGWWGLTLVLASIRYRRAQRRVVQVGARLGLLA